MSENKRITPFLFVSRDKIEINGVIKNVIIYDVISPDGVVYQNSMITEDRTMIKPGQAGIWHHVSYCPEKHIYTFPDKDDPGKDFMLMEELIRFLDDIMVDDILS